jgi:hypothetical protein
VKELCDMGNTVKVTWNVIDSNMIEELNKLRKEHGNMFRIGVNIYMYYASQNLWKCEYDRNS